MSDLLQAVTAALNALITTGVLAVEASTYDAKAFGNAVVVLRGRTLRVRFLRDRSQVFVELACLGLPEEWHSLQRVLAAVGAPGPAEGPIDVDRSADLLVRHLLKLEAEMCGRQTTERLAELGAEAKRNLLQRLKGGTN
jgi:negative regulator of replication initiation